MKITRVFSFSAAHHLTDYYGECERPHGHTYRLAVTVEGPVASNGLVVDFAALKKIVNEKVILKVDHRDLNDFFKNPSAENIAIWIWKQLKNIGKDTRPSRIDESEAGQCGLRRSEAKQIAPRRNVEATLTKVQLKSIQLWEGDNTSVIYEGD